MKKLLAFVLSVLMVFSCFVILPITASAEDLWDGSTSTAPAGSGTEDDPYLIASGANLKWMQSKTSSGGGNDYNLYDVFKGVYFKQTADINLGGHLMPSIGSYIGCGTAVAGNTHKYTVFGGIYDGQGYTIKNGTIANANKTATDASANWPTGLFGIIKGATIKNVKLEGISLYSSDYQNFATGLLVGYAMAENQLAWVTPASSEVNHGEPYQIGSAISTYRDDYNNIINCSVSGTLTANSANASTENCNWGGIVGIAYNTTVEGCTANVAMNINNSVRAAGGIVGYMRYGGAIRNCVNRSSITFTGTASNETSLGGIVGYVTGGKGAKYGADVTIENCVHDGSFTVSSSQTATFCIGGIAGAISKLSTDDCTIDNCYNTSSAVTLASTANARVAGLVGVAFTDTADADYGYVQISNSYSNAALTGTTVPSGSYKANSAFDSALNTILYTQRTDRKNLAGKLPAEVDTATVGEASLAEISLMQGYKSITGYSADVAAANRGWEMDTLTQGIAPAGEGTEDNPYLISCVQNLVWMGNQIWSLNNEKNVLTNPFQDSYFVQVCDIDLGGKAIRSIGYYDGGNTYDNTYSVFGGHYNGQGFAIRNGYVVEPNDSHGLNINWAGGLFGMIYGATIENVNLQNVACVSKNVGGVLVGRSLPKEGANADASFNVIRNCSTDADCYVRLTANYVGDNYNPQTIYRAGGIIGYAECVTVENCTNNATVYVTGGNSPAGGIAGSVGFGTWIKGCINNGILVLNTNISSNTSETALGGIAGAICPVDAALVNGKAGNVTIESCYNTGHMEFLGSQLTKSVYWGGILGGASNPNYQGTYLIKNCYNNQTPNLISHSTFINSTSNENSYRFGSIMGCAYLNNANAGYVLIQDCYGVKADPVDTTYVDLGVVVANNGNTTGKNPNGGYGASVQIGNTIYAATSANASTVKAACILSADAVQAKINAAGIQGASMRFVANPLVKELAAQKHKTESTVRFIATVSDTVDWTKVGFDVIASYTVDGKPIASKENTFEIEKVYTAIVENDVLKYAPEGYHYVLLEIRNVPTDRGDVTFYVTPYAINGQERTDGATLCYVYDMDTLSGLSDLKVAGSAPIVGYNPNVVGAVNVAETLQKKLVELGAPATLSENGNIAFNVVGSMSEGTWKIDSYPTQGILVTSDSVYGLLEAYEYMLPKLGLTNELTTSIKSASGTYELDKTETGELRVMYHNILTYSAGFDVLDRAALMKLTFQTYMPDVIGLQEAGTVFATSSDFADLRTWLSNNYVKYQAANNVGNPIYVKKNTFTVVTSGYVQSRGDKGSQYVVLTYGGKTFAVTNSHFEADTNANDIATVGNQYRYESAVKLINLIGTLQTDYNCAVISGGDFNSNLWSSPAGLELTMGTVTAGSTYKHLVKYDASTHGATYQKDANGYAYRVVNEENVYLTGTVAVAGDAGHLTPVRHIAKEYQDSYTMTGIKKPGANATRYETVVSISKDSKNCIDHVFYKAGGSNITFNEYKVLDNCFALTSSDHAPHYVDFVLN